MRSWSKRFLFVLAAAPACLWITGGKGLRTESILYCLCVPLLLAIGIADEMSGQIPPLLNLAVGALGLIRLLTDPAGWREYLGGMLLAGGLLLVLFWTSGAKGIGGGDVKLIAAAGLLLGVNKILPALFLASLSAVVIHSIRMRLFRKEKILAFGPYLCTGIFLSMLWK